MVNSINNQAPILPETVNQKATENIKTPKESNTGGKKFANMDTVTISQKSETSITYTSSV